MDDMNSSGGVLLREGDALFCEFDENMKEYYFGEDGSGSMHGGTCWCFLGPMRMTVPVL